MIFGNICLVWQPYTARYFFRVNASLQCFLRHFRKKFRYWHRIFLCQIMYFLLLDALVQHLKILFKKLLEWKNMTKSVCLWSFSIVTVSRFIYIYLSAQEVFVGLRILFFHKFSNLRKTRQLCCFEDNNKFLSLLVQFTYCTPNATLYSTSKSN